MSHMNTRRRNWQWLVLAVVAATPVVLFTGSASAQYRTGTDGRALDANNQVGNNGVNQPINAGSANRINGNDIVTGNVTGDKQFRGRVPYTDPTAFRGNLPGQDIDRFIARSSGTPTGYGAPAPLGNNAQPFYGASRGVAPPPGFTEIHSTGGYVPAKGNNPYRLGDQRLDASIDNPVFTNTAFGTPPPGQLILPGAYNPTNPSLLVSSSLYGVRQLQMNDPADQNFLSRLSNNSNPGLNRNRLDPGSIQKMRDELQGNVIDESTGAPALGSSLSAGQSIQKPFESPNNQALGAAALNSGVTGNAMQGNLATNQGQRDKLLSAATPAQGSQVAELQRRLEQANLAQKPQSDQDANREFMNAVRAKQASDKSKGTAAANANANGADTTGNGGTGRSTASPAGGGSPSANNTTGGAPAVAGPVGPLPQLPPETVPAAPLRVTSLADGIKARGLAGLLKDAETQMRAGKFEQAIETYNTAAQVAPTNPLIALGRAHAELGASFYARAEQDIRDAVTGNPALLMGQYDLKSFYGESRLQEVIKDLKEIAQNETTESRPVFLLAYIAYNAGNEQRAAEYLNLAQKRSDGNDPLYKEIRGHWKLPTTNAPALNK